MPDMSRPRTDLPTSEKVVEKVEVDPENMVIATNGCLTEKVPKVILAVLSTTRSRKGKGKEKDVIDRVLLPQKPHHRDDMATVGKLSLKANSRKGTRKGSARTLLAVTGVLANLSCKRRKRVAHSVTSVLFFAENKAVCQTKSQNRASKSDTATAAKIFSVESRIAYLMILHHCRNQRLDPRT